MFLLVILFISSTLSKQYEVDNLLKTLRKKMMGGKRFIVSSKQPDTHSLHKANGRKTGPHRTEAFGI